MNAEYLIKAKSAKFKIEQEIVCSSLEDFLRKMEVYFNFDPKTIKIMKPRITVNLH